MNSEYPGEPKATVGRIVHYVMPDGQYPGEHRPAIVLKTWSPTCVQLAVLVDGTNDYPHQQFKDARDGSQSIPVVWRTSVCQDEVSKPGGSWHWPERG